MASVSLDQPFWRLVEGSQRLTKATERAGLASEKPQPASGRPWPASEEPRGGDGWMDGRTDVWTDRFPLVFYRTPSPPVPFRAAAQKGSVMNQDGPAEEKIDFFHIAEPRVEL